MIIGSDGRVSFSTVTAPNDTYISGFRCDPVTGAIRALDAAPVLYSNGYGFTSANQLCISTAGAIAGYHAGLAFTVDGRLCVEGSAPITNFNGGYPMAAGRLAASGVAAAPSGPTKIARLNGTGQYISMVANPVQPTGGQLGLKFCLKFAGDTTGDWGVVTLGNGNGTDYIYVAYRPSINKFVCYIYDATGFKAINSEVVAPFTAGLVYFRVTSNTGVYIWETSTDGTTWTEVIFAATSFANWNNLGAKPVWIGISGSYFDSGAKFFKGDIARVQLWNDSAMTVPLFDCDPSQWTAGTSFDSGGKTWNLIGGATVLPYP